MTTMNEERAREAVEVVGYLDAHDCLWNATTHPDRMIPLMTVAQHNRILAASVPAGCKAVPVELLEDLRDLAADAVEHHRAAYAGYNQDRQARMDKTVAEASALLAAPTQPAAQQHPDGAAVDRFAVAMKAKLAKSREKGRHGWQMGSAAYLSSLLYHHMYKGDPLDVASLAMMLHQNGQAIELPQEARRGQGFNKSSEVQRLREALDGLYGHITARDLISRGELHRRLDAAADALAASTGKEVE